MFVPECAVPRPSQRLKHKTTVSAKGKHLKITSCYLVLQPKKKQVLITKNRENKNCLSNIQGEVRWIVAIQILLEISIKLQILYCVHK